MQPGLSGQFEKIEINYAFNNLLGYWDGFLEHTVKSWKRTFRRNTQESQDSHGQLWASCYFNLPLYISFNFPFMKSDSANFSQSHFTFSAPTNILVSSKWSGKESMSSINFFTESKVSLASSESPKSKLSDKICGAAFAIARSSNK